MKRIPETVLIAIASLSLLAFYACPLGYPKRNFPNAFFPDSVCNLSLANSEFDDINMDLMEVDCNKFLVFSSNRLTSGGTYDLVTQVVSFSWDQVDGGLSVRNDIYDMDPIIKGMATATHTLVDEYGPLSFVNSLGGLGTNEVIQYHLIYSDNENGSQDVRFLEYNTKYSALVSATFADSLKDKKNTIPFLSNQEFNEGYVSFLTSKYCYGSYYSDLTVFSQLIYCNDSLGNYNIFSIAIPGGMALDSFLLQPGDVSKTNLAAINSTSNDRCPNVNRNFMVFSSNRPGGLGGYDFYYSIYENGQWSEPVNFGAPINSAYDEYRAITVKDDRYENDLLIFSSNRPGGKGGFDIYYTGIDVMPE